MDEALIQHAQDDIDGDDRDSQQNPHIAQRTLEGLGLALELAQYGGRNADLVTGLVDGGDGVASRHSPGSGEGDRHRRQLPQMVDAERHGRRRHGRHRIDRAPEGIRCPRCAGRRTRAAIGRDAATARRIAAMDEI